VSSGPPATSNGCAAAADGDGNVRKTVVVTGATGYVASQLLPAFRERYDVRLIDITREGRGGRIVDDVTVHDLHDPDLEKHRPLITGAHAIVHLAYNRVRGVRGYLDERVNLDMAYHVYQLALKEGVERVVMASSNHAADWYEDLVHAGQKDIVSPDERPLARNFYGWAKASYEHMGSCTPKAPSVVK
jgi:nucleoside-diphosphate-sugar epimerase